MRQTVFLALLMGLATQGALAQRDSTGKKETGSRSVHPVLTGRITDAKTGNMLAGATIYFPDAHTGAIATGDGSYKTRVLGNGKHLAEISYQGYATVIREITVQGNTTQDFALQPAVVEQENVTVTGVTSAISTRRSPQSIEIVKHNDLLNTSSTNVIDALTKTVPGVAGVTTGPAISKPFIRGLGYNRVLIVNDAVRQEGQQWGDEHGIEVDDYSVKRIEVLKGPASLMYGSDALAGVINIQSLTPAPEGSMNAHVLSEYQTNSRLRGFYGDVAGTKNGFSWSAYGSYKGAADYRNKYDGPVFNSKFYNKNVGGLLGYSGSWGYSHLMASSFDQHIGFNEGERDSATGKFLKELPGGEEVIASGSDFSKIKPVVPFQHIRHFKVTSDNAFNIGKSKLDVTVGYQRSRRQEFGNVDDISTPDAFFDLKTVNYSVRYHLPASGPWRTSFGSTGMYQTNTNRAAEVLIPDYSLFDIGGFVFEQYSTDKLTVSGGVRFDNRHVNGKQLLEDGAEKFAPFTQNFSNLTGSVGASYALSHVVNLKANIARGFRAPNMAELASNGAHEGTVRYEVGDHNLKSETSLQGDAGVEVNSEHVSLDASLFYNHITNFIYYRNVLNAAGQDSTVADPDDGSPLNVFKFAQQTANLYGVEMKLDIHPHPLDWLHFENIFSYTRGKFTQAVDDSKNLPFVPSARYISELRGNFFAQGKNGLKNLYVSVESDYTFDQNNAFTGFATETATPGYWLINASIGSDFTDKKGRTLFSLHLAGYNLGDVAYQSHLSRLKYLPVNEATGRQGIFNMGRNFSIKLEVPLSFHI
ncbi:TonB-dependent receptor [Deminuibacter soli]|uniref:TonB-dependent receptor n=1 Tax=Deminuibacter soli TaxID=2291815 RepID=A0A3E1NFM2_9BACT|nr:TonB-dependent receptor [Deminuibacter soli]RFM26588.1 TonB-dependent receptor [Deminuibacter soli]